ncbi:liprin-alpha-2 isoform X3 [Benincasa hispida]|uniref:liprin-alpha-2 isoform X3 n=1 Tax=Benincasa hispida TaxID=102211 RepID=UPI0018FF4181|nr:liprin-alpha-2 isoform X3 [Benincasa hispida]XP_038895298.1 liprin-alpha-2 isoform X3 [Benincasa hispida]XP_038895299.1 liprin-alpha-2 isoform X3 [Benincasa hispida]
MSKDSISPMLSRRSISYSSSDLEELLEIESRCRQLKKEKDTLIHSRPQSFDLIRRLELHVNSLSEASKEDKLRIESLEKELTNCTQEIDYLQDQLCTRNTELNYLVEHVENLEFKLVHMERLQEKAGKLEEEVKRSNSEYLFLMQKLDDKEKELQESNSIIEKLEESISAMTLESQCEIESMKLDMVAMEQRYLETKKVQEEALNLNDKMDRLIEELQNAQKNVKSLERENKELQRELDMSTRNGSTFCRSVEELIENKERSQNTVRNDHDSKLTSLLETSCGEVLGQLLPKLAVALFADANSEVKMDVMAKQIQDYELLVMQLKEELREEKLKAKEEAEDLAQEMAELRYQITGLLEEECKRRACIEQASLQRIAQLEAQVLKEQNRSFPVAKCMREI